MAPWPYPGPYYGYGTPYFGAWGAPWAGPGTSPNGRGTIGKGKGNGRTFPQQGADSGQKSIQELERLLQSKSDQLAAAQSKLAGANAGQKAPRLGAGFPAQPLPAPPAAQRTQAEPLASALPDKPTAWTCAGCGLAHHNLKKKHCRECKAPREGQEEEDWIPASPGARRDIPSRARILCPSNTKDMDWLADVCGTRFAPLSKPEEEIEQPLTAKRRVSFSEETTDPTNIPVIDFAGDAEMEPPTEELRSPAEEKTRLEQLVCLLKAGPQSTENTEFLATTQNRLADLAKKPKEILDLKDPAVQEKTAAEINLLLANTRRAHSLFVEQHQKEVAAKKAAKEKLERELTELNTKGVRTVADFHHAIAFGEQCLVKATPCTYAAQGLARQSPSPAAAMGVFAHTGLMPILQHSFAHMLNNDERIPKEHAVMIREAIEAYAKHTLNAVAAANGEPPVEDFSAMQFALAPMPTPAAASAAVVQNATVGPMAVEVGGINQLA